MADLNQIFDAYVAEKLALSREDTAAAAKSREWLVDLVKATIAKRVGEPSLLPGYEVLYYGSYFKGTKVGVVDEFDILVRIDSNSGIFSSGGAEVGTGFGVADPNHKYDDFYQKEGGGGVSPTKMLNWLKGIVEEAIKPYGGKTPIRDGQAVTARIESKDLRMDFVPGGVFKNTSGGVFYNIPRGDAGNSWLLTAPERDMERLEQAAKGRPELKNIIRVAKRVKDTYKFQVSSFAIETAIVEYAEVAEWKAPRVVNLWLALHALADKFRNAFVADTFDPKRNLLEGADQLEWYADRLDNILAEFVKAEKDTDQASAKERVFKALENT